MTGTGTPELPPLPMWHGRHRSVPLYTAEQMEQYARATLALNSTEPAEIAALRRDAERLDFLDRNQRLQIGWQVNRAPAGNLSVTAIIMGGKPIREAIDAALAAQGEPQREQTGCGFQAASGQAFYPDLMCTDGYMSDMDDDGDDPTVARQPCPKCNPDEYNEWIAESKGDAAQGEQG